jgi:hypothetical protein
LAVVVGGLSLFTAQEALAFKIVSFNGKFTRWGGNQAHYILDKKGSQDFNGNAAAGCDASGACETVQEAIQKSFDAWEQIPGVDIRFTEDSPETVGATGYDHKNDIVFVDRGWRSLNFAPPPGALAVTICTYRTSDSANEDCDINFNGEYFKWGVINSANEENSDVVDIQNIATHEIGHFIGLDHSSEDIFEPNQKFFLATMFFASGPGEIFRRELKDDDILAARNLYPSANVSEPVVDAVDPGVVDASAARSVTVKITGRGFVEASTAMIAVDTDQGDIMGNVVDVSDTEMNVTFDLSKLHTGEYDVVVANAYDRMDRVPQALAVSGGFGSLNPGTGSGTGDGQASSSAGGCSVPVTDNSPAGLFSGLLMILFPLILIGTSRVVFAQSSRRAETRKARQP